MRYLLIMSLALVVSGCKLKDELSHKPTDITPVVEKLDQIEKKLDFESIVKKIDELKMAMEESDEALVARLDDLEEKIEAVDNQDTLDKILTRLVAIEKQLGVDPDYSAITDKLDEIDEQLDEPTDYSDITDKLDEIEDQLDEAIDPPEVVHPLDEAIKEDYTSLGDWRRNDPWVLFRQQRITWPDAPVGEERITEDPTVTANWQGKVKGTIYYGAQARLTEPMIKLTFIQAQSPRKANLSAEITYLIDGKRRSALDLWNTIDLKGNGSFNHDGLIGEFYGEHDVVIGTVNRPRIVGTYSATR